MKIKKCPFCGGEPRITENTSREAIIECSKCKVSIYCSDGSKELNLQKILMDLAITKWNRRIK